MLKVAQGKHAVHTSAAPACCSDGSYSGVLRSFAVPLPLLLPLLLLLLTLLLLLLLLCSTRSIGETLSNKDSAPGNRVTWPLSMSTSLTRTRLASRSSRICSVAVCAVCSVAHAQGTVCSVQYRLHEVHVISACITYADQQGRASTAVSVHYHIQCLLLLVVYLELYGSASERKHSHHYCALHKYAVSRQ
jgi:hypothetical protein